MGRLAFTFAPCRERLIKSTHRSLSLSPASTTARLGWLPWLAALDRVEEALGFSHSHVRAEPSVVVSRAAMAQSSFLRQLREQLAQGDTGQLDKATRPWQQQGGRHVPQDTLVCDIYDLTLLHASSISTSSSASSQAASTTPSDPLPALHRLRASILSILTPHLSAYLFHHSSFTLVPVVTPAPHLTASLYFGDCVDDELLVCSLLFQVSAALPELCLSVEDDGGYFLLAEVADALPQWMSGEERLTHRVWLQGGQLRVIDEQLSPAPPASRVHAVQLLAAEIKRGGEHIAVPQQLQSALVQRLADYPAGAMQRSRHFVRCLLPLLAVRVLQADGSVASGAANAFYTRDMIDMRTANKMLTFLPVPAVSTTNNTTLPSPAHPATPPHSASSIVPYRVRLTRLLYAQLSSQPFTLPRSLLAHPSLLPYSSLPPSSPQSAALSLSFKLLAGLEMYYHNLVRRRARHVQSQQQVAEQQAKRAAERQAKRDAWQRRRPMSEQEVEAEVRRGGGGEEKRRRWGKYVASLRQLGWFAGVKREEEEERWRQRVMMGYAVFEEEEERREDAERTEKTEQTELTADERRHLAVIEGVLERAKTEDESAVAEEVERWAKWEEVDVDDSDEWLHVSKEEFERKLAEKEEAIKRSDDERDDEVDDGSESDGEAADESEGKAAQEQAQSIIAAMKVFMGAVSGHEGAEVPNTGDAPQLSAAEKATARTQPSTAPAAKKAAAASEVDDKVARQQQLMRVLECDDEKRLMSEMSVYERAYGEGSFERDLMASAGEMRLDEDDEEQSDGRAAAAKAAHRPEAEVKGVKEEAEDSDEGEDGEEGDEAEDDGDELMFGGERGSMRDYLAAMSKQLSGAGFGQEFERRAGSIQHAGEETGDDEDGSGVDADVNLLKNMLDSLTSQHGMAGPAGNLLGAMNVDTAADSDRWKSSKGKANRGGRAEAR